jgi:hypothetical protein
MVKLRRRARQSADPFNSLAWLQATVVLGVIVMVAIQVLR